MRQLLIHSPQEAFALLRPEEAALLDLMSDRNEIIALVVVTGQFAEYVLMELYKALPDAPMDGTIETAMAAYEKSARMAERQAAEATLAEYIDDPLLAERSAIRATVMTAACKRGIDHVEEVGPLHENGKLRDVTNRHATVLNGCRRSLVYAARFTESAEPEALDPTAAAVARLLADPEAEI